MLSVPSRESTARRVLWCLGLRGKPEQVMMLLFLLDKGKEFSAPGLMADCGLSRGIVYYFVSMMKRRGVVVPRPRSVEPAEWAETYGIGVRRKMRRENNVVAHTPLTLDLVKLRELMVEKCSDSDVLGIFGEADA